MDGKEDSYNGKTESETEREQRLYTRRNVNRGDFSASDADQTFYYCVDENRQGKLVSTTETDAKNQAEKAQCTCPSRTTGSKSAKDNIITVTIAKDGTVSAAWGAAT